MTFVVRRTAGRNHYYVDLDIGPRARIPGVTTVGKVLVNRKIEHYQASSTAAYAVNNWDELAAMPPADRLNAIMRGRNNHRDSTASIGTKIHRFGEKLLVGEPVDIPPEFVGYVDSYVRFMERSDIAVEHVEVACYSVADNFAGTIDIVGDMDLPDTPEWEDVPRDDDGRSYGVLDPKTGSGIYETAAFQIIAYTHSERLITAGATSKDREIREEIPTPRFDFGAALHIHPDGSIATLHRVDISNDAFEWWRVLRGAYTLQGIADEFLYPPTDYPYVAPIASVVDDDVWSDMRDIDAARAIVGSMLDDPREQTVKRDESCPCGRGDEHEHAVGELIEGDK